MYMFVFVYVHFADLFVIIIQTFAGENLFLLMCGACWVDTMAYKRECNTCQCFVSHTWLQLNTAPKQSD